VVGQADLCGYLNSAWSMGGNGDWGIKQHQDLPLFFKNENEIM